MMYAVVFVFFLRLANACHDAQTLEALQFLRSHNIAHRDVRSDNLLLNNEGVLKLSMFAFPFMRKRTKVD